MTVVGFAGMTHLGLVSATGIASKGLETICYDGDPALIERLQRMLRKLGEEAVRRANA